MADYVTDRRCAACGTAPATAAKPSRLALAKALYCPACRAARRRRPVSTVTPEQGAEIARWIGVLSREAIAHRLGVSRAAVARYTRDHGLYGRSDAYPPAVVAAVCAAYEAAPHGFGTRRVQELFPEVAVRSIVERYRDFRPRQIRWTAAQIHEAAKMAGLVSPQAQARYFGRPYASDGSIKALWAKRFQCNPHGLHGLAAHLVFPLCGPGTQAVLVHYQPTGSVCRPVVLWGDLVPQLPPDVDPEVRHLVEALARFQRWLHGGAETWEIAQMMRERERDHHGDHVRHAREWTRTSPDPGGDPGAGGFHL